jgi:ADP-heptose:LPS heptosyltransferase
MNTSAIPDETYEDCFSRAGRWLHRLIRPLSWWIRGTLGLPRTLLVELRWRLGDELMALPVLAALRERHPDVQLVLLTNYPELFACAGIADKFNTLPPRVDRYILLRGAPRHVERLSHYAQQAGLPRPSWRPNLPMPPLAPHFAARIPSSPGPLIALAPGASWPNKRWLPEHWADLARQLSGDGTVIMVLGHEDAPIPGDWTSFMGETTPLEAGQLLALADLLICCDSGLMHLALAVGTPALALFGPTDPAFLSDSPLLHAISNEAPCAGFWNHSRKDYALGVCPCGQATCLAGIAPARVYNEAIRILRVLG